MSSEKSHIGKKIKLLRQKVGVLPEDLAPIVDLPSQVLAQIENGATEPTVATLLKLSQYFNVPMETFFGDEVLDEPLQVVRAEEHEKVERRRVSGQMVASYQFAALAPNLKDKHMQPFFIQLDPNIQEDLPPLSHEGEEFMYVLEGEIEFHADHERILLREGDSIYFHSEIPHAVYGKGSGKSKAVVVIFPEGKKQN